MKLKIAEAVALEKQFIAAEKLLKKEELDKLKQKQIKEAEERKAVENNIYERPQSKALADSFLDATKEIFLMRSIFENSQDTGLKSFRMKAKMAINKKTAQLTDSLKQIKTVASELVQLCFESRTISKQAFSYCLVLLSTKILVN